MKSTEVILTLDGRQTYPGGQIENIHQSGPALMTEDGSGLLLQYDTVQEGQTIRSSLSLSESALRMEMQLPDGTVLKGIVLRTGETVNFDYETPYGALKMVSRTESVRILRVNKNIHARVVYELCMDDSVSDNIADSAGDTLTLCTMRIRIESVGA